jgi:hypothetical protein
MWKILDLTVRFLKLFGGLYHTILKQEQKAVYSALFFNWGLQYNILSLVGNQQNGAWCSKVVKH